MLPTSSNGFASSSTRSATRTLLRVDMEAAAEAAGIFEKPMGEEVEPRRKFIEENARYVRNLDV